MISVSEKFRQSKDRRYYITASCTMADGTALDLQKNDIYISGNGIVDSSDSTDFPLGCAIEKTATLCLVNDDDRFSTYNFNKARFVITLNLDFEDGTSERMRRGTFVVIKKPATAGKISLTLVDRMHYADKAYSTNLVFPTTAGEVLRDSCQTCGILLGDASFPNDDYVISEAPANTTHRAVIGNVAMLAGGNARIDEDDRLRIIQFNKEVFASNIYDGGTFRPWTGTDATIDGGTFRPWTGTDATIDGGAFKDMQGYHMLYRIKGLQVDTDDVIVTGIKTTVDQVDYTRGEDGYVVNIKNDLISGNIDDALQRIGEQVIGLRMRPFSCQHIACPTATFLDPAYVVDVKNNVYETYLTNVEFSCNSYTKLSNTAKSAEEEVIEHYSGNSVAVEQVKKNTEKMLDQYDIATRNMNELAANLFGFYPTTVVDDDGSRIDYWHDKPNLSESKTVYKKGIDGFFVTQDYQGADEATSLAGKWKAGFTSNGDATLNILYAIGIAAEWINTRGLTARDNEDNVTFRIDPETGAVDIVVNRFSLTSGKTIEGIAGDAAEAAASDAIDAAMTQQAIFDKLTNGGETQGVYLQNGKLYLNATYMQIGKISSKNGRVYFDLDNNELRCTKLIGATGNNTPTAADIGNPDGTSTTTSSFRVYKDGTPGTNIYMSVTSSSRRASISGNNITRLDINSSSTESAGDTWLAISTQSFNLETSQNVSPYGTAKVESDVANSRVRLSENVDVSQDLTVQGNLRVLGTKPRLVSTPNYGNRLQYCYEMASPMFGDIGEGVTDDNGECCIFLDNVFLETVSSQIEYQVFLQKEGQGDVWVDSKEPDHFVVKGAPDLKFAWEVKVSQRDYEFERLDDVESLPDEREVDRFVRAAEKEADRESEKILQDLFEDAEDESMAMDHYISEMEDFEMKTDAYLKNMEENGYGTN